MPAMNEPRKERLTITATEREREVVDAVATLHGITRNELLRKMSLADIVAEYDRTHSQAA
jgi:hypothetical protein